MANLLAPRDTQPFLGDKFNDIVKSGVQLYKGAGVLKDADGYLINAVTAAVGVTRGVAQQTVLGDGTKRCEVRTGMFQFHIDEGDAVDDGDCEQIVYWLDNHTISKTSNAGANPPAGRLKMITIDGQAIVGVGPLFSVDGDLVAANNLSDVASVATARANIGANVGFLSVVVPLDAAGVFYLPLPKACTIIDLRSAVEGATTTTGAATITAALDAVNVTNGVITIAVGAVVGEKDVATPSAANVATEGQNLRLTVAPNSQDAAAFARVTAEFTY